ncbi:aldehyde dehydrogenase [Tyzzerella sp. An114]|uniref:aldehyde dehydrogenase n=1 Tax=Tyzzerella sp. An114 TaxID=1965545 RepID=UPI000B43238F|nr:aldehyde dehydrogenase [Tyzzerella sp. An114]OUQ56812.1 aldehyde dehydrogenase [Tyzzerella sp. An114]
MKQYEMYINGEFIENGNRKMLDIINPARETIISKVPFATKEDVDKAIDCAYEAQKSWAKLPAIERGKYLHKIASLMRENIDTLATVMAEEQGKTMDLSITEVNLSADYLDFMAEFARRYEGEILQSDRPNENILIYKQPIGVVAGILPWNFPVFSIVRKVGPALLTGNTIVIKPSSETPNNAFEFAKLVDEAKLPKGVFNLVTGSGSVVGNAMSSNPKVGFITMTGSVPAGTAIMKAAADNITKVSLELGGKAPVIVMEDADLDEAAKLITTSRVTNTGQACSSAERIYVQESIADEFTAKVIEEMKKVTYGDPLTDTNITMGPLVSKQQQTDVDTMVKEAVAEGAEIALGGTFGNREKGFFYEPTVLINCKQDMKIIHNEIFGPVMPIVTFKDFDQVLEYANDCEFGLTSAIFTKNINYIMRAANELKFGETYVNREHFEAMQAFHSGFKKSGIGGDDGKYGLEEFLQTHVVYIQYDTSAK